QRRAVISNRRQADEFPFLSVPASEQPPGQVPLMQPLHDQDDRCIRSVLAAFQRVLEPLDHATADDIAARLVGLVRIVNQDRAAERVAMLARAVSGNRAARTYRVNAATFRGAPLVPR